MSRSDRLKEELGWLKIVFAILVAIDLSLVGWLAENYQSAARLLVICAFVAVTFTTTVVVFVNRAAMRRFEALEDE
jgi:4-hydroxybenzoate polyprenyltransferase